MRAAGHFPPLREGHPAVGERCGVCECVFRVGDITTVVRAVPASPEDAEKSIRGAAHVRGGELAHGRCADFA